MKARATAAAEAAKKTQSQLDPHLRERELKTCVIPYTDALFRQVAIEWLIATDQVRPTVLNRFWVLKVYYISPSKLLSTKNLRR